jgi:hypothetical protein
VGFELQNTKKRAFPRGEVLPLDLLEGTARGSYSLSNPAGDGDDYGDDNDNAGPGSTPPGTPPGTSNPQDTGATQGTDTPLASDLKEHTRQCPPSPRKPIEEEESQPAHHTKTSWAATNIAKEYASLTKFERYASGKHSQSIIYAEMLADFFTPQYLKHKPPTPVSIWPPSDDCPDNYKHGKFMVTLGQLVQEGPWEVRRFHLWYMKVTKVGLCSFVVKVPAEYFHLPDDAQVLVDFHDMHRVLQCKDLDVAQVTLFAL